MTSLERLISGVSILRALYAVPGEVHTVRHTEVAIYEDEACTRTRPNVQGVVLESTSSNGLFSNIRIFPTRRTYYRPGTRVSWEWDDRMTWGESWYEDPETMKPMYAWTSSIEFVGRTLSSP